MMAEVKTTFTLDAGVESSDELTAEIDSRPSGLNRGKSDFRGGDDVYILLWKSIKVINVKPYSNIGENRIQRSQDVFVDHKDEMLVFDTGDLQTASLSKATAGEVVFEWQGNSLPQGVSLSLEADMKTYRMTDARPLPQNGELERYLLVVKVAYQSKATAYKMNLPALLNGEANYSVQGMFVGEIDA